MNSTDDTEQREKAWKWWYERNGRVAMSLTSTAFMAGYDAGADAGWSEGYDEGYDHGYADALILDSATDES